MHGNPHNTHTYFGYYKKLAGGQQCCWPQGWDDDDMVEGLNQGRFFSWGYNSIKATMQNVNEIKLKRKGFKEVFTRPAAPP